VAEKKKQQRQRYAVEEKHWYTTEAAEEK